MLKRHSKACFRFENAPGANGEIWFGQHRHIKDPGRASRYGTAAPDPVVKRENADQIVKQWTDLHCLPEQPTLIERVDGYPRQVWRNRAGEDVIKLYTIPNMTHGTPLAAGSSDENCGVAGAFLLEVGISSSYHIAKFCNLCGSPRRGSGERSRPATPRSVPRAEHLGPAATPLARGHGRHVPEPSSGFEARPGNTETVITNALRSAGLLK